ncbi:MAG TPA: TonB-dependent receptor [Steroidobacteraceae bacterium]|nr:TonB-dependent receptor [Steroidobacteraceae bacterium]
MKKQCTLPKNLVAYLHALFFAGIVVSALALPIPGWSQSVNAVLRGQAPANSQVTARNVATGAVRRTSAGADGSYTLVGLPPGTYRVDAGPGTEQTVTLTVASAATLDLTAGGGAEAEGTLEEIIVKARRPVEVKTSQVGADVSLHEIETTPQITRNFLEFADTVPGMLFQVDAKGNTSIRSGAQNTGATNVYIDGIGQKNYVRASGIAGQGGADPNANPIGDPGNPFPQLAIGEYKVITSNYKAEYDQISGAAITAVTKSGTNTLHAEVFGTYTSGSMRASTPVELASGRGKQGGPSKEYGFAVGGPIIMDKLHYFFTYEGKEFTTPNSVHPPQLQDDAHNNLDVASWLTPELRANYGPVANPFKEGLYFAKLDWELSDADRLDLSGTYRRERQQAGASGVIAASAASTYINDENRYQLRWEHTSGRLFNEAMVTYEKTNDSPSKSSDNPGIQYVAFGTANHGFDPILQTDGVDPRSYFFTAQKGYSLQDDLTISNVIWRGDHTFKTGIKVKDVQVEDRDAATTPLYSYYVRPGGVDAHPLQVIFGAQTDTNLPTVSISKNRQFGVYFQDDWSATDRLLFNLGVRYDYEQTPTYTDYVTPQRFVDAINGLDTNNDPTAYTWGTPPVYHGPAPGQTYAQTLAKAGININDYISNGHNRKNPSNEIAPRLGFSYDLSGDQRHVVFAAAGRSYDRNVFGILQHETNKANLYVPTVRFQTPGSGVGCTDTDPTTADCIPWSDAYLTPAGLQSIAPGAFGEMHFMNNHLKAPYSDQFSIGMRNKVGDWHTSVTVARIMSHDGLIATEANYFGDGTWWWYASGPYAGYTGLIANAGGGALFLFDNAKESRTTQVLISCEKPYTVESGWSASIAYTYSYAKDRLISNGDYQLDYGHPWYSPFVFSNQLPQHRLVATGSIDAPWGLTVGAKLVFETPKPYTGFDQFIDVPENGLNYNYLKISQYPDETIGYQTVDLQLTKSIALPGNFSADLRLDLLNAANSRNYAELRDGWPGLPYYFTDGDLAGVPRTLKVTLNVKF